MRITKPLTGLRVGDALNADGSLTVTELLGTDDAGRFGYRLSNGASCFRHPHVVLCVGPGHYVHEPEFPIRVNTYI